MEAADQFQLLRLDGREAADGSLPIFRNGDRAGIMLRAHDLDESLSASVLLENLACKTTGALALEHLLARTGFPADDLQYVIGSGEEAALAAATSERRSPRRPAASTLPGAT